jgi:hypothetical protein
LWNQTRREKEEEINPNQIKDLWWKRNPSIYLRALTKKESNRIGKHTVVDLTTDPNLRESEEKLAERISFLELPWNLRENPREMEGERERVVVSSERERGHRTEAATWH